MKKRNAVEVRINNSLSLLLSKHLVKFKANDGWELSFDVQSVEGQTILYLCTKNETVAIQNLATMLYFTKLIVSDTKFSTMYDNLLKEYMQEVEKANQATEQEHAEALAEQKVLHEQTEEAVKEHSQIKKEGDNDK